MQIADLLNTFPRRRPPISAAHKEIYADEYKDNRTGKNLIQRASQWAESWMHRYLAASGRRHNPGEVLEIGAGSLNHLPYEEVGEAYDVIEPMAFLYEDSPNRGRVRNFYSDIRDIADDTQYRRIISVAVLEHLEELPFTVVKSGLLLADGGVFQAGIPSEGGLLWGVGWRATTGLSYRMRTGLSYGELMHHEHINDAGEIIAVVRHFFDKVEIKRFPLPTHHLSLYAYIHATEPKRERCLEYFNQYLG